jgi:LPS sulfotransferase NodH
MMRNFIIFGQGRSGSNLLVHLLQSHPQIQCDGEMLSRKRWRRGINQLTYGFLRQFPVPYIVWKASRSTQNVYGFKLFIHHIPAADRTIYAAHARDWQIVHIQRRNLFDQAVSKAVATVTMHWVGFDRLKEPDTVFVTIPPKQLLATIQGCVTNRQRILQVLKDVPHILVTYEEDLLDEDARNCICGTIFQAVGVEQRLVSTTRQRSWNRPYRELIVNYEELLDLMATAKVQALQAEWERLFD